MIVKNLRLHENVVEHFARTLTNFRMSSEDGFSSCFSIKSLYNSKVISGFCFSFMSTNVFESSNIFAICMVCKSSP